MPGRSVTVMRAIGNNAAVCVDASGRELVALGRGIGFGRLPKTVSVADIVRTFYGIDAKYLSLVEELDPEVLEFSAQLADVARAQVSHELSPNLPITLADHIAFAIKRAESGMVVAMPLSYDVQESYPIEYRIGELAVRGVNRSFGVHLARNEAVGMALAIVNAAVSSSDASVRDERTNESVLANATDLLEEELGVKVDRDGFDYVRFATHLRYLVARMREGRPFDEPESDLYVTLTAQYPEVARASEKIASFLAERLGQESTPEEKAYLMLHAYRLRERSLERD